MLHQHLIVAGAKASEVAQLGIWPSSITNFEQANNCLLASPSIGTAIASEVVRIESDIVQMEPIDQVTNIDDHERFKKMHDR